MAATFAVLIGRFGGLAIFALVLLAGFALVHSHRYHDRRSKMEQVMRLSSPDRMDRDALALRRHLSESLRRSAEVVDKVLTILVNRKRKKARKLRSLLKEDIDVTRDTENEFVRRLNAVKPQIEPWLMKQLDVLACERDMLQSATTLVELAGEHVLNEHSPPTPGVSESLLQLKDLFGASYAVLAGTAVESAQRTSRTPIDDIAAELDRLTGRVLEDMYAGSSSTRNTTLMLAIVLELRDMLRELKRVESWR
jgi:hypothetical protein